MITEKEAIHSISLSGKNWCLKFHKPIDYHLVKEIQPECIEEHNGCGNCPYIVYRQTKTINYRSHGLKLIEEEFKTISLKRDLITKLEKIADHHNTSKEDFLGRIISQIYQKITKKEYNKKNA